MANYIPQIRYDDCYGCKACLYNCPVSLFTLSHKVTRRGMRRELPEPTKIELCIGCGVCSRACPVEAIDMIKTQPEEGKESIYMDWDAPVRIDPNKCIGCTACARICPSNAIKGSVKNPHVIDEDQCIRCGLCMTKCKKDAIYNTNEPVPALLPKEEAPKAEAKATAPSGEGAYKIDKELCKGCTACKKACPNEAIIGEVKVPHEIDPEKCVACGACEEKCKFGAISQG